MLRAWRIPHALFRLLARATRASLTRISNLPQRPGRSTPRHDSPTNENASNPDACSNFVQHQVAGDFKDEVANEENPKGQPILVGRDTQLLVHRPACQADVRSVKEGNDVQQEEKWNDPDSHPGDCPCLWQKRHGLQFAGKGHAPE
jgi:hypothetical protein